MVQNSSLQGMLARPHRWVRRTEARFQSTCRRSEVANIHEEAASFFPTRLVLYFRGGGLACAPPEVSK